MGFLDFAKAVYHQANPFDNGRTYRTHYDARKRREDEERWQRQGQNNYGPSNISVGNAQSNQNVSVEQPKPKPPVNIFETLNKDLVFNKPKNTLQVIKDENTKVTPPLKPGVVVRPTNQKQKITGVTTAKSQNIRVGNTTIKPTVGSRVEKPKPKQNFNDRFRDIFDANTEADQYRRSEGNRKKGENKDIILKNPGNIASRTPVVGYATKGLNTLGKSIPQAFYTGQQALATREYSAAIKSGNKERIRKASDRLDDVNRLVDASNEGFEKNKGGFLNTGTLYDDEAARRGDVATGFKDITLPSAVAMLDLYTLGRGAAIEKGVRDLGVKSGISNQISNIGKATAGNYGSGDLDARSQGATNPEAIKSGLINSILGIVPDVGLPALGRGFTNKILPKFFKGRGVDPKEAASELEDVAASVGGETASQGARPRPIPVRSDIPVSGSEVLPEPVRVRNLTEPKPVIQEFPGDASVATPDPLIQRFADDAREEAGIAANNATRPDQRAIDRFEGIKPGEPPRPFTLDERTIEGSQDKLINDYADLLRQVGEGNGVAINKKTGARVSNNARFGDTSGKRMNKDAWLNEAERQLREGTAEPEIQKAFDEAADPEVQSLLAKGEQAPVEQGRPIKVQEVKGIDVRDKTVIPQNLPEKPGTVRVTAQTAPNNAKSEVIAAQTTPSLPPIPKVGSTLPDGTKVTKRMVKAAREQRKNAKALAKAQEETAVAMEKVNASKTYNPGSRVVDGERVSVNPKEVRDANAKKFKVEEGGDIYEVRVKENNHGDVEFQRYDSDGNFMDTTTRAKLEKGFGNLSDEELAGKSVYGNGKVVDGPSSRQPGLILSDDTKKGKKGVYQVAHQADQTNELGTKSVSQVIQEAETSKATSGSLTDRDIANVKAALDSGTYKAGTPEYKKLSDLYWKDAGTHSGQQLALRNQSMRRTGSAKELYNRAVSKLIALSNDPTKVTNDMIVDIEKTTENFVNLRDASAKAADDFKTNPTKENYDRFMQLDKQLNKAEKTMAMSQYTAAKKALKGNTNVKLRRLIEDAADNADMYTMDFVDSALLSSTGTFTRNFVNASLGSAEEGLFGGIGARVGRRIKGTPVGGGVGRGSLSGFGKGAGNIVDASKARFKNAGWNPFEHMKNWSTTGNQLGDSMIEGSVGRSVRNHYEQLLKKQGYTGDELRMRADVMARTDPDNLARDLYAPQARKDAGLGSGMSKRSSFEKETQRKIADSLATVMGKEYSQGGEALAKGITRLTLGFPSAVGRSIIAGSQRVIPLVNVDTVKAFTAPDKTLRAAAIKESIKKSGSAATLGTLFYALGANNMITGAYPKDPDERARWEREGIKENSIKIGDAWYDAPSYMGSFGVPALIYGALGRNGGISRDFANDALTIAGAISPTDGITKMTDALSGKYSKDAVDAVSKYGQSLTVSGARMATPYGSLLNQVSKIFDETQNDTSSDSWAEGLFNKLLDGIPFVDSKLPDKTDSEGNTLYNPSVAETLLGAAGAVQGDGEQRSQEINKGINDTLSQIDQYGLLGDKNLDGVLEGTGLEAFNKAKSGKQLDESEVKALREGLVKGVSQEGTDTAYLEKGQYDTNLAVLKLKRDLMNSDPTVKPSSLKDIDTAIKRGEVYRDNQIPYDMIKGYQDTSLTEWRNMGDPEDDDYDQEMYDTLWKIDELMTKAKVSDNYKGDLDKPKYSAKTSKGRGGRGRGRGGGRGSSQRAIDTSFGTLGNLSYAPKAKQYATIDDSSGQIPYIAVKRPNIVHKITSSG